MAKTIVFVPHKFDSFRPYFKNVFKTKLIIGVKREADYLSKKNKRIRWFYFYYVESGC